MTLYVHARIVCAYQLLYIVCVFCMYFSCHLFCQVHGALFCQHTDLLCSVGFSRHGSVLSWPHRLSSYTYQLVVNIYYCTLGWLIQICWYILHSSGNILTVFTTYWPEFSVACLSICSKSNQIYLLKTHHISMQQVVKQLMSRANKAQKSTYSDPKTTS